MAKSSSVSNKDNKDSNYNTLVLDIGNSDIKGEINGEQFTLPSNYSQWCGANNLELRGMRAPFDGFSVYDYNNNPAEEQFKFSPLGGKRLLGDGDKLLRYKNIVQGCCGAIKSDAPWKVVLSYWNPAKLNLLPQLLKGTHSVMVNGVDNQFTVDQVIGVAEGAGAHALYRKEGAGTFVTVDIGYNTLIFRSTSDAGVMEHHTEPKVGVCEIVSYIQKSPALVKQAGTGITDRAVIEAIKSRGILRNNQREIPDIDISPLIKSASANWMEGPLSKLVQEFSADVNQASAIWLIGGGANLLREFTQGTNIHVPADPGFTNLAGMSTFL
ncbi:hypothetical protein U2F10_02710 [Leptothoe sp. EHU-05/26/07-4]